MVGSSALKVAIIAPIMVNHDGISLAALDNVETLAGSTQISRVIHFGEANAFSSVDFRRVSSVGELLSNSEYLSCDVAIFHFGIYHSIFNALLTKSGPRLKIVQYHNVTPIEFVSKSDRDFIGKSLLQREILRNAQELWCDSEINRLDLVALGFDERQIQVIPLSVDGIHPVNFVGKNPRVVEVSFLGRIVPSKGVHDLLDALETSHLVDFTLKINIVGNTLWSDKKYLEMINSKIAAVKKRFHIQLLESISDLKRNEILAASHILVIPSYHEGFCRPIIEGFRSSCVPIVYDAFNLPLIVSGLGKIVPTGSVGSLREAIDEFALTSLAAINDPDLRALHLESGWTSANKFTEDAHRYAKTFEREHVTEMKIRRILELL